MLEENQISMDYYLSQLKLETTIKTRQQLFNQLKAEGFVNDRFGLKRDKREGDISDDVAIVVNKDTGNIWIQHVRYDWSKNIRQVASMNSNDRLNNFSFQDLYKFAKAKNVFEGKSLFKAIKLRTYK